jgi:hypothetical protein
VGSVAGNEETGESLIGESGRIPSKLR